MAHNPPNTRRVLDQIDAKIRLTAVDLRPDQAFGLKAAIDGTRQLMDLLKRSRLNSQKRRTGKKSDGPKRPAPKWAPVKGIYIDGIRCCRVCKKPVPHKTKADWRLHMLAVKRRHMQQKAKEYWTRVGYDTIAAKSVASRHKRSIERKLAIFKEECPLSAAKMSQADITRLILGYINPKTGYMHGPMMFRKWVKKRFR